MGQDFIRRVTTEDFRAVARALTIVENDSWTYGEWWSVISGRLGGAYIVGLTGWPGVGKSTLMGRILEHVSPDDGYVGVVAVDPSSHRTGGAVLGDRLRMMTTVLQPNIFIRSLASRGSQSGVSKATLRAIDIMDAAGFHWIFVETVGVGQTQVDILELADAVVLVTAPGLGDEVQAIKAGILEIPDLIVVNMADRPEAHRTVAGLRWALGHSPENRGRIIETVAVKDVGTAELWSVLRTLQASNASAVIKERRRARQRRRALMFAEEMWERSISTALSTAEVHELLYGALAETNDPYDVGVQIVRRALEYLSEEEVLGRNSK